VETSLGVEGGGAGFGSVVGVGVGVALEVVDVDALRELSWDGCVLWKRRERD